MQNDNAQKVKIWDPLNVFRCPADYNHAVVVLNRPIRLGYDMVFRLWNKAKVTVTVDGGTNRWMNYLGEEQTENLLQGKCKDYLPTLVTGDMDSIEPELLQKMEKIEGTKVIRTPDQNQTDYTKALTQLQLYASANDIHLDGIIVLAETSGRFDHIVANINTLYKTKNIVDPQTEIIQLASNSLTWLLKAGRHKILIPDKLVVQKCWCALVPFGNSSSRVSTTGLRWNLNDTRMEFGGMVSTSNTYSDNSEVTVTTNEDIIWSMGIEPFTTKSRENSNGS
ncbi:thiamin pyrophosphokinase 1 isoform X2 [Nasonia vitripennis]|uniref:Thiamin pyrophosphokinase thiamin-binding domain-containing protein n=1 Tax=Nasonia vitripennis TaxID=7425 RepID=A0A7M7LJ62_NASVI|nr:thiamin pyrophosphokinase 1 isoform X2 [Nasonia vitripennis]